MFHACHDQQLRLKTTSSDLQDKEDHSQWPFQEKEHHFGMWIVQEGLWVKKLYIGIRGISPMKYETIKN